MERSECKAGSRWSAPAGTKSIGRAATERASVWCMRATHDANLYQQTIPSLVTSTNFFSEFKGRLSQYADEHLIIKGRQNNIQEVMQSPVMYNMLDRRSFIDSILEKYSLTLKQTRHIIKLIEAEEK